MEEDEFASGRAKLIQRFGDSSRTGGKGTMRRKKKAVRKNASADDTKLKSALKKLNMQQLPGIEQVNMFQEDNSVLHF